MPKRKHDTTTPAVRRKATSGASNPASGDALEQRVVAFADHLGQIVGTVHAKAEGWLDRDSLTAQVAIVRDAAAGLLEHLSGRAPQPAPAAARAPSVRTASGRSGGRVDAPGKKHRAPLKTAHASNADAVQAAKVRAAKTMVKTDRRRGRG